MPMSLMKPSSVPCESGKTSCKTGRLGCRSDLGGHTAVTNCVICPDGDCALIRPDETAARSYVPCGRCAITTRRVQ